MVDGTVKDQIPDLPETEQQELFDSDGWTWATDQEGDLRITDQNQPAITRGTHAIALHLKVALASQLGDDPLDDDFGLDVNEATRNVQRLRRELRRTLIHDDFRHDRISSIGAIDIYAQGGQRTNINVDIEVYLKRQPENTGVTFSFNLFSGSLTIAGITR